MTQHPAGWYPQPDGSQSYWDGTQWTQAPGAGPDYVQADTHGAPGHPHGSPYDGGGPGSGGPGHFFSTEGTAPPKKPWFKKKRFVIPAALVVAIGLLSQLGGDDAEVAAPAPTPTVTQVEVSETPTVEAEPAAEEEVVEEEVAAEIPADPVVVEEEPAPEPAPEAEPVEVEPTEPDVTVPQQQAIRKAETYLDLMPCSRAGLIGQLEFEGFPTEDATFAVDHIVVDWNEQAVRKAESYLDLMGFSRSGLIDQLEYEECTTEQATFGVDNITVDWNEQAALKAESYLDLMSFSRSSLITQLEYEGFTREQAEYGATAVGF